MSIVEIKTKPHISTEDQLLKQTPQIVKIILQHPSEGTTLAIVILLEAYPTQTTFAPILKQIALSSVERQMKW